MVTIFSGLLAITVNFTHFTSSINENGGPLQPSLVLSNPSATDIIIEVFNTDGSATGEYCIVMYSLRSSW